MRRQLVSSYPVRITGTYTYDASCFATYKYETCAWQLSLPIDRYLNLCYLQIEVKLDDLARRFPFYRLCACACIQDNYDACQPATKTTFNYVHLIIIESIIYV